MSRYFRKSVLVLLITVAADTSTPILLTLDNEEARISVGSNVPFLTGQYSVTGSTASAMQSLRADARRWLLTGETSLDEVLRATQEGA